MGPVPMTGLIKICWILLVNRFVGLMKLNQSLISVLSSGAAALYVGVSRECVTFSLCYENLIRCFELFTLAWRILGRRFAGLDEIL